MSPDDGKTTATESPPAAPRKKKLMTLGIVLGIMLLEGAAVFAVMKISASPVAAEAAEDGAEATEDVSAMPADVSLVECKAINRKSGQALVVRICVAAQVDPDKVEVVQELVQKRQDTIKDRVQTVLRSADPRHLNDPDLATLKRQIKFELDRVLGDDQLIRAVLIPQILQSRSDL